MSGCRAGPGRAGPRPHRHTAYSYTVSQTQPDSVTTKTLVDSDTGLNTTSEVTSVSISDAFGTVVQTQQEVGAVADSAIDHRTRTTYGRAGRATAGATYQGDEL